MKKICHSCLNTIAKSGLFIIILTISCSYLVAQERCPVPQLLQERAEKYPELDTQNFEKWLAQKQKSTRNTGKIQNNLLRVPVVFHIIHNGEPVGIGGNILKNRIDRQLEILNEDFNSQNADTTDTLEEFKERKASLEIEFVYAKQDPDGFETDGIVRVAGSRATYSYAARNILSAESYWPAEDYLNIWVADLAGGSLGWAEFPVSNLAGLEAASNNRLIDGVSLDYVYFGDNPNSPSFASKGRTATHEMGHFFGLRHIWGDGGCSVDDFCLDTPPSSSSSTGCNLTKNTCGSLDMVQNFMDYTNDACMNLFTIDQKARVRTVIENSPRRKSLTASKGLNEPPVYDRDLGLTIINSQYSGSCTGNFTPQVTIKNQGLFPINEYMIEMYVNGDLNETLAFTETLQSGEEKQVYFSLLNFSEASQYTISYSVKLQGAFEDERLDNNQKIEYYQKLEQKALPYTKKFDENFDAWAIRNSDKEESWQLFDSAIGVPFFENRQNFGEKEEIISPLFDFTSLNVPELSFVFAQVADSVPNRVSIYASYDCGRTFEDLIFSNSITDLSTAYSTDSTFIPEFRLDWDTLKIDLNRLKNKESVCFSIVAENRLGNNFYISEFNIEESSKKNKEIELLNWVDLNPLFCEENLEGTLTVQNIGRENIRSFSIEILNNNQLLKEYIFNDEVLIPGQISEIEIFLARPEETNGELEIRAICNDAGKEITNTLYAQFQNDCREELPPLRLTLQENETDNWFSFNPDKDKGWSYDRSNFAINSNSSQIRKKLSEDWLISPILDVSNTNYLGLIFDVSYRKALRQSEKIEVYISDDHGTRFTTLLYSKEGDALATSFGNDKVRDLLWRNEFIDLSPYVFRDKIRVAIKVIHDSGQDIYLKNISFFVGQSLPPAYPNVRKPLVIYPNPASNKLNLHLNLDVAEKGFFQILDTRGNLLLEFRDQKILNQFITFDVSELADGMYFLRLNTKRNAISEKFIIKR